MALGVVAETIRLAQGTGHSCKGICRIARDDRMQSGWRRMQRRPEDYDFLPPPRVDDDRSFEDLIRSAFEVVKLIGVNRRGAGSITLRRFAYMAIAWAGVLLALNLVSRVSEVAGVATYLVGMLMLLCAFMYTIWDLRQRSSPQRGGSRPDGLEAHIGRSGDGDPLGYASLSDTPGSGARDGHQPFDRLQESAALMEPGVGRAFVHGFLTLVEMAKERERRQASSDMVAGDQQADITLGQIVWPTPRESRRFLKLRAEDQRYHALILGKSGMGKSKFLQSIFVQHFLHNGSAGLIEPTGDLTRDILEYLVAHGGFATEESYDRLAYLDFGADPYVPFNVLAPSGSVHETVGLAKDAMTRAFPELAGSSPMFTNTFLSAAHVLVVNGRPLTDMFRLLVDPFFRERLLVRVDDDLVRQTFRQFEGRRPREIEAMVGSTLRRVFELVYPLVGRMSLGASENVVDMRRFMDQGTSVLISLGRVRSDSVKALIGAMLMVQLEQAAESREDTPPDQRRPMTFMVDEWTNFAAQPETIKNILERSRKYGLSLYLSSQSIDQENESHVRMALENCSLNVAFQLGRETAEFQARNLGHFSPSVPRGLPQGTGHHPGYASPADQRELLTSRLQNLPKRNALVKLHTQDEIQIETLYVADPAAASMHVDAVIQEYYRRYHRAASAHRDEIGGGPADTMVDNDEGEISAAFNEALDNPNYWDVSQEG